VAVNERNMLEWHYLIQGPPDSPYAGGWYIGKLRYPERALPPTAPPPEVARGVRITHTAARGLTQTDYPFKPPGIMILTPNGRFDTGKRLCLSMSDYHPEVTRPACPV
jgi:ubiquitin-conjugating enzyme E2 J2